MSKIIPEILQKIHMFLLLLLMLHHCFCVYFPWCNWLVSSSGVSLDPLIECHSPSAAIRHNASTVRTMREFRQYSMFTEATSWTILHKNLCSWSRVHQKWAFLFSLRTAIGQILNESLAFSELPEMLLLLLHFNKNAKLFILWIRALNPGWRFRV